MNRFNCSSARERTADSLIELAHCSQRDRIIVAEPKAPEIMFELNRRGSIRVATTAMWASQAISTTVPSSIERSTLSNRSKPHWTG